MVGRTSSDFFVDNNLQIKHITTVYFKTINSMIGFYDATPNSFISKYLSSNCLSKWFLIILHFPLFMKV